MKREDEIIKSLNYTRCSKEYNIGSSEIWSDKLKDLYIRHTESRSGLR